jgi:CheY-like chemotaxis protein
MLSRSDPEIIAASMCPWLVDPFVADWGLAPLVGASPPSQTPASCNAPRRATGDAARMALRCLIIDDSPEVLRALASSLESEGVDVVATASGRDEGIARALESQPECILLDVDLGEDGGPQVAEEMAALGLPAAIILISAYREYFALAESARVRGFLSKTDVSRAAIERLLAGLEDDLREDPQ